MTHNLWPLYALDQILHFTCVSLRILYLHLLAMEKLRLATRGEYWISFLFFNFQRKQELLAENSWKKRRNGPLDFQLFSAQNVYFLSITFPCLLRKNINSCLKVRERHSVCAKLWQLWCCGVTHAGQSEASIQVTWPISTNQRPLSLTHAGPWV